MRVISVDSKKHMSEIDGKKILEENGFLPKEKDGMEDGIPLPPWCQKDDTGASAGAGSSAGVLDNNGFLTTRAFGGRYRSIRRENQKATFSRARN